MKKYLLLISCLALSATLAHSQNQTGTGGAARTGSQTGANSSGQAGVQTGQQQSPNQQQQQQFNQQQQQQNQQPNQQQQPPNQQQQVGADGQIIAQPGTAGGQISINESGNANVGNTNRLLFGGTNQVRFGGTNTGRFINDPSGATVGTTNQIRFGTNTGNFAPTNINRNGGKDLNGVNQTNQAGDGIQNSATADQIFSQQLNVALSRGGATRIFFPQTRSTITVVNQNGSLVLQGFVASEEERRSIEARVKNSPDVTGVVNQLQIANPQNTRGINPQLNSAPGAATNRSSVNP